MPPAPGARVPFTVKAPKVSPEPSSVAPEATVTALPAASEPLIRKVPALIVVVPV